MLIIPDVSIWFSITNTTMLSSFILEISSMWRGFHLDSTGVALFKLFDFFFVIVVPSGGTSTAVRCVAASSVPPSPATSTAATAIGRTGRAAPSACVKVTELWPCCKAQDGTSIAIM